MKNLSLIICIVILFSCKENATTNEENQINETTLEIDSLEGAWKLVSFFNYRGDGTVDTILSSKTNKQIKMYSPTKVMWSRTRISDSIDWFAYGDYNVKNGVLTEILDYGSKSMNEVIKDKTEFKFNINITENEFSQIEIDSLGHPIFAENYIRIE
tara:strand:+ start:996 stop:1463 length:468 start_codon:yes stop_codon:yes gene_type:complete